MDQDIDIIQLVRIFLGYLKRYWILLAIMAVVGLSGYKYLNYNKDKQYINTAEIHCLGGIKSFEGANLIMPLRAVAAKGEFQTLADVMDISLDAAKSIRGIGADLKERNEASFTITTSTVNLSYTDEISKGIISYLNGGPYYQELLAERNARYAGMIDFLVRHQRQLDSLISSQSMENQNLGDLSKAIVETQEKKMSTQYSRNMNSKIFVYTRDFWRVKLEPETENEMKPLLIFLFGIFAAWFAIVLFKEHIINKL